jgi:hypothetical protein
MLEGYIIWQSSLERSPSIRLFADGYKPMTHIPRELKVGVNNSHLLFGG